MTTEALTEADLSVLESAISGSDATLPWVLNEVGDIHDADGYLVCGPYGTDVAAHDRLIVAAVNALPRLLATLRSRPTPLAPWTREEVRRVICSAISRGAFPSGEPAAAVINQFVDRLLSRPWSGAMIEPYTDEDGVEHHGLAAVTEQAHDIRAELGLIANMGMDQSIANVAEEMDHLIKRLQSIAAAPLPPLQKAEGES